MSTQLDENIPITMAKGTFRVIFDWLAGSYEWWRESCGQPR
jgi:hypothetical protein